MPGREGGASVFGLNANGCSGQTWHNLRDHQGAAHNGWGMRKLGPDLLSGK